MRDLRQRKAQNAVLRCRSPSETRTCATDPGTRTTKPGTCATDQGNLRHGRRDLRSTERRGRLCGSPKIS